MGIVYRGLVRDSAIPSDPRRIAAAAMMAIARRTGSPAVALPDGFGADLERDADVLTEALPGDGPWWDVLSAMAWHSDVPHTAVTDAGFAAGMAARMSGAPLAAPGFALWRLEDGRLGFADVDPAGSAHAAGIQPGDVLLEVDGRAAVRANSEVLPFHTAPAGAVFDLTTERDGARRRVRLTLEPGEVACVTQRAREGGVGHVRVRWFATSADARSDAGTLVREALSAMAAAGAPGVVIDVRSGLGGMLSASTTIVSALCDDDVVGADRDASGMVRTYPRVGAVCWPGAPVVVLVNEQTISAAEWLALGLEELAGAVLVGTPTAGGLNALRFIDLADGHRLAIPSGTVLGPRTRRARPGARLTPQVHAANPTARELAAGVDPALDVAVRTVQHLAARR